ncbi:MAG TPA: hypothetical protein VM307_14570 [Egibacteraceae bacterium]|nr:hypothetical protein [Egibacteraceae bacterium]
MAVTDALMHRLDEYAPAPHVVDTALWNRTLRGFVMPLVMQTDPQDMHTATRWARLLARIAEWSLGKGIPLDVEAVLDPHNCDEFVAECFAKSRSRSTYVSHLAYLGRVLTVDAPWPRPRVRTPLPDVSPPYTSDETEALWRVAQSMPTVEQRQALSTMTAAGAGAGLDGHWYPVIRPADVRREDGVVLVTVGAPSPRTVPVLAEWEDRLWEVVLVARRRGDRYLISGRAVNQNSRMSGVLDRLGEPPGAPRFNGYRFRSTWLVRHLAMGTPLPLLTQAAGMEHMKTLQDLMPFVPLVSVSASRRALRGPTVLGAVSES